MILLSIESVSKRFGPEPVLSGVTFEVRPGERIGLVGPNGCGKTTLLKIVAGQEEADRGAVQMHPSVTVRYLEQHPVFDANQTVWDVAAAALSALTALVAEAEQTAEAIGRTPDEAERRRLGQRFDFLQQELHRRDGYHVHHKIERVLEGLGFDRANFHQSVRQLSGGQQNRLLLAQLLLAEPDLMLLDEPSNHLDMEATQWLEEFLSQSKQAVIVVSHDRYFLDKVTKRTLELFSGTVDSYAGNFSAYWRQKGERLEVERRTYERQQTEIAKLKDFIRRHHYGQKHAQAEDRRKKLERIQPVPPPRQIETAAMGFPPAARSGEIVVRAQHLTKRYDQKLFEDLSFEIARGQRWAILGGNGTGKTTLLRCLLGEEPPDDGQVTVGTGVDIGYFDQQLQCLRADGRAVDVIRPPEKEMDEGQRRSLLARFGVVGDLALQPVARLSGGERNRVALARLAAADANFLVLDEPTNHLDLWARDALERSLKRFDGTVLFVSHDRYFINQVADYLLVVEPDGFRVINGNYDLYLHLVQQGLAGGSSAEPSAGDLAVTANPSQTAGSTTSHRADAGRRKRKFPYRKVEDLESEIFDRETVVETLHEQLTLPDVLRDGQRVKQLQQEIEENREALKVLYEHWDEATELN